MIWPFTKKNEIEARVVGRVDVSKLNSYFVENETVNKADFSGATFDSFTSVGSRFLNCSFENVIFRSICFGAGTVDSIYENCSFNRATINATAPGNARFINCTFENVDFKTIIALNIEMVNCRFSGIIRKGFFNGEVPFSDDRQCLNRQTNMFEGNDFSECKLVDFEFRTNIDLSKQVLPEGWENGT